MRPRTTSRLAWLKAQPHWLRQLVHGLQSRKDLEWGEYGIGGHGTATSVPAEAEALSSLYQGASGVDGEGLHALFVDLDVPAALIDSSTPGHHHLVIPVHLSLNELLRVLQVLADVGIVEQGYVDATRSRGAAFLRAPWVRKDHEKEDATAAFIEWLDSDEDPLPEVPATRVPF